MLAMYIGNERIKILHAMNNSKQLIIKKAVEKDIFSKDGKSLSEKTDEKINVVVPAIYNCLTENQIKSKNVYLVVDDALSLYRELVVPKSNNTELRSIVYNEMAQILNDITEYIIDYQVAYEFLHNNHTMYKVSITALQRTAYLKYANIIKTASLNIKCMNISSNCFTSLMNRYGNYLSELPYILVNVEDYFLNFVLFEQGMRILSRSVDLTTSQLVERNETLFTSTVVDNISRMMQFQMTQKNRKPVSRLYITGNVPRNINLDKLLANKFNLGIGILPRLPNLKCPANFNINKYSNLIGAYR